MSATLEATIAIRDFKVVQRMIYDLAGISLADSKQIMVHSRLAKRLRELNITSYSEYLDLLQKDPDCDEMIRFINALTTNKTDFFRENHHFEFLTTTLFPKIKQQGEASGNRKLRIWCSASSTGEEPYSIAMTVRQYFGCNTDWDIRILASDIDTEVLTTASKGVYPSDRFTDVSPALQKQYFDRLSKKEDAEWAARESLRELITFRRINLQQDWAINTQFDVIFCRNVMIYFDASTQKKLVERFRGKLVPAGHLIIGHSESLFGLSDQFKSIGETIYQKTGGDEGQANVAALPSNRNQTSQSLPRTASRPKPVAVTPSQVPSQDCEIQETLGIDPPDPKFPIIVGEVRASQNPEWISTLLGSCVATCLYDEVAKVGGMNHFMLPDSNSNPTQSASFGVHAMEILINRIMNAGGDRRRLKAKVFGGGAVIRMSDKWNVGAQNVDFARRFLETERIPIVASHTGGSTGMQIQFHTHSAKVLVRELDSSVCKSVLNNELKIARSMSTAVSNHQEITLF